MSVVEITSGYIMHRIEYKNFINDWSLLFPEFATTEDLNYPYLAAFSDFFMQKIETFEGKQDQLVQRVFDIINYQFELPDADTETLNLLQVEIFENLVQTKKGIQISEQKLTSPRAVEAFKEAMRYCGTNE